jgi:hypothetical protein
VNPAPEHPGTAGDPETVYRTFLHADVRPVINAASTARRRAALHAAAAHLCDRLRHDITAFPAYSPGQRPPWAICQTGNALRAGFELTHAVTQAIAGSYLHVIGFNPAAAISAPRYHSETITPALNAARPARLHATLLALADHAHATTTDADLGHALATQIHRDGIPDDLWDTATAVTTAITLYQHAAVTEAAQVLCAVWDALDPAPALFPLPASPN